MKYSEFKEKLEAIDGVSVYKDGIYIYVDYKASGIGVIDTDQEGVCDLFADELTEIEDIKDRKYITETIVNFANTKLKDREQEKKYYWKLKGIWKGIDSYLNYGIDRDLVFIDNWEGTNYINTKFTEEEFLELADRFGFIVEAFEKEEV